MSNKKKLYIVDGTAYIFRAYYGVSANLTSPSNVPTNAIFGFKNMLIQLLKNEKPEYLIIVFDAKGNNFRHELYDQYKANRSDAPDDLKLQIPIIQELVTLFNIPTLIIDDYEADDVIGSLSHQYSDQAEICIISSDKDLTQLVNEKVTMLDTMKNKRFTIQSVEEKFGVPPRLIAEYLALVGDASDNIPGAKGVGAITATKLLQQYHSLDGIKNHISEIKGKLKEKVENSWDLVELSLKLTTIYTELRFDQDIDDFARQEMKQNELDQFYQEYGLKSDELVTLNQINRVEKSLIQIDYDTYILINDEQKFNSVVREIEKTKKFAFDLETTSLDTLSQNIVGFALAWGEKVGYIPCCHDTSDPQLKIEFVLQGIKKLFMNPALQMIGHNLKFDLAVLQNYQINCECKIYDTLLEIYLLHSDKRNTSLDKLSFEYFKHSMIGFKDITEKGKNKITFDQVSIDEAVKYAGEDADITLRLHEILYPQLVENGLKSIFHDIEIPVMKILTQIEKNGVLIDTDYLKKFSAELKLECKDLEGLIYQEAGQEFNLNSPQQLSKILFEVLNIQDFKKKTKTGFSTDSSVLERLSNQYPIAKLLIDYRIKTKLINTYLDVLPELVHHDTKRIHTSYNQFVAATGRLSSNHPNLQNIPIRGKDGYRVRKAFIPSENHLLCSADYSQIELRVLAHFSQDKNLIKAFADHADIHSETAKALLHLEDSDVSDDARRIAKAINYGIVYGMGAFRLSQDLNIPNKEAKQFIEKYFAQYPNIKLYMNETIEYAKNFGHIKTLFNRKRTIQGINDPSFLTRSAAERVAINSRIQGTAADIIKIAMIQIDHAFYKHNLKSKIIMQVHDELVFDVVSTEKECVEKIIKDGMSQIPHFSVPLEIDIGFGTSWQEAH